MADAQVINRQSWMDLRQAEEYLRRQEEEMLYYAEQCEQDRLDREYDLSREILEEVARRNEDHEWYREELRFQEEEIEYYAQRALELERERQSTSMMNGHVHAEK